MNTQNATGQVFNYAKIEDGLVTTMYSVDEEVMGVTSMTLIRVEEYDTSLLLATYDENTYTFTREDGTTYTTPYYGEGAINE